MLAKVLPRLPVLEYLDLSGTGFYPHRARGEGSQRNAVFHEDGAVVDFLSKMPSLKHISLEAFYIGGEEFESTQPGVTDVYPCRAYAPVSDRVVRALAKVKTLESISLAGASEAELSQDALNELHKLPNLRSLNIVGVKIKGDYAAWLSKFKTLSTLDASGSTKDRLEAALSVKTLENLTLSGFVDDGAVAKIAALPKLQVLKFVPKASDESLLKLANAPSLKELHLVGYKTESPNEFRAKMAATNPNLMLFLHEDWD
jgi:hypothetical protein